MRGFCALLHSPVMPMPISFQSFWQTLSSWQYNSILRIDRQDRRTRIIPKKRITTERDRYHLSPLIVYDLPRLGFTDTGSSNHSAVDDSDSFRPRRVLVNSNHADSDKTTTTAVVIVPGSGEELFRFKGEQQQQQQQ